MGRVWEVTVNGKGLLGELLDIANPKAKTQFFYQQK